MSRQPYRIIIEGMDGSGKSTLIGQLAREFPQLEVVRRPPNRHFDDWWPEELERTDQMPIPIHDRFFYSELVYGPILRGKINANMELVNNLAWFMRSIALLIYTRPYSEIIRKSVYNNPQMEGVIDKFDVLLETYDSLMSVELQWYSTRFYRYDWNAENALPAVTNVVRRYLTGVL